jgi:hypothetical protein
MARAGEIGLLHVLRGRRRRGWGAGALGLASALLAVAAVARAGPPRDAAAPLPQASHPTRLVAGGAADFVAERNRNLDRVAAAVGGAESSYGTDPGMWRADPLGPQGPMQVSAAAAADVGGGNRFDVGVNLALGRAYLARMYRRYGSWAEAVAAYNWGPGHLDAWISGGRRAGQLPAAVERYIGRVLLASSAPGAPLILPGLPALRRPGLRVQPGLFRLRRVRRLDPRDPVQQLYAALMQASAEAR